MFKSYLDYRIFLEKHNILAEIADSTYYKIDRIKEKIDKAKELAEELKSLKLEIIEEINDTKFKIRGSLSKTSRKKFVVHETNNWTCQQCFKNVVWTKPQKDASNNDIATIEHIIPYSFVKDRLGASNLTTLCYKCNKENGSLHSLLCNKVSQITNHFRKVYEKIAKGEYEKENN